MAPLDHEGVVHATFGDVERDQIILVRAKAFTVTRRRPVGQVHQLAGRGQVP